MTENDAMNDKPEREQNPLISIILPVFNEEEALGEVLDQTLTVMEELGEPYEILIVDDGSTDNSVQIGLSKGVRVISHPSNLGTGASRKTGILECCGERIVMSDADRTYPVDKIPELLNYLDRADLVIGDREQEAGTIAWLRKPTKSLIRRLASYVTGSKIYDLNSGLRAFRKSQILKLFNILPNTHSWVATQTIAYLANGLTVKYVPIYYFARKGQSSFHPIRDTWNYASLVFRTVMYFNPLKIFIPLSAILTAGGMGKLLYEGFVHDTRIRESTIILVTVGITMGVLGLLADLQVKLNKPLFRPRRNERKRNSMPQNK